jgi:hypothetical protein
MDAATFKAAATSYWVAEIIVRQRHLAVLIAGRLGPRSIATV